MAPGLVTMILAIIAIIGVIVNDYMRRKSSTDSITPRDPPAITAESLHKAVDEGKIFELIQLQEDRCVQRYCRELDGLRQDLTASRVKWEKMLETALSTMNQVFANTSERMTVCENTMKGLSRDVIALRDRLDDHIEHHG